MKKELIDLLHDQKNVEELLQKGKTVEDVKAFVTSKGVQDCSDDDLNEFISTVNSILEKVKELPNTKELTDEDIENIAGGYNEGTYCWGRNNYDYDEKVRENIKFENDQKTKFIRNIIIASTASAGALAVIGTGCAVAGIYANRHSKNKFE